MKNIMVVVLFSIGILYSNAQKLIQNTAETKVDFKIKNLGFYVDGNFSKAEFNGDFDVKNLSKSNFIVKINVNSLSTGNKKRDGHLFKEAYFDVEKYPTITFSSTKMENISENKYQLSGSLTIKNITKNIVIPIEIKQSGGNILIKSDFELNRRDYGVGGNSLILSDTVNAQITYSAKIN